MRTTIISLLATGVPALAQLMRLRGSAPSIVSLSKSTLRWVTQPPNKGRIKRISLFRASEAGIASAMKGHKVHAARRRSSLGLQDAGFLFRGFCRVTGAAHAPMPVQAENLS
jgi:hypothetical protein